MGSIWGPCRSCDPLETNKQQVAEVVGICKSQRLCATNHLLSASYQTNQEIISFFLTDTPRMYNAITREIEPELMPCCRKYIRYRWC